MDAIHVMAFDLGASNGRAIVASYENQFIKLTDVHRFSNDPVRLNNHLYWDFPRLFHELKIALIKAKNMGFELKSVGIDSWGVDYGLLDEEGELVSNPIHYRDSRGAIGMKQLFNAYDKDDLKMRTGMDCVSYNTINQLLSDKRRLDSKVKAMLNIPDLFNYFLTGVLASEYSVASTTQLYNYREGRWNRELIEALKLPLNIFQEVIPTGSIVGEVKEEIIKECGIAPLKVVSVTSHDTASAIRSVVSQEKDFLFIATGTWIIVGSKQERMTMNEKVMAYGLTNEGGKYPNVNLLKNHVGLWILQECRRHWRKEGIDIDFSEMVARAQAVEMDATIDIADERFFEPNDMPLKIVKYCEETGQRVPKTIGEVVRVVEQSLAQTISETLSQIEDAVGKTYDTVHIFGGGIQDPLLCHLIGTYSGKQVIIGQKEATAYGNVMDQLVALGAMKGD